MMSTRPFNPPFHQTNPNGRFWAKTDDLGKLPADLIQKLGASMQNPGDEYIEYQGWFYRAEKSQDGKSMFLVQRSQSEVEEQKKRDQNGGKGGWKKGGGGRPVLLAAEEFTVATVIEEVNANLRNGFEFVVGENGLQIVTFAARRADTDDVDVVNGLFMVKPKVVPPSGQ